MQVGIQRLGEDAVLYYHGGSLGSAHESYCHSGECPWELLSQSTPLNSFVENKIQ